MAGEPFFGLGSATIFAFLPDVRPEPIASPPTLALITRAYAGAANRT